MRSGAFILLAPLSGFVYAAATGVEGSLAFQLPGVMGLTGRDKAPLYPAARLRLQDVPACHESVGQREGVAVAGASEGLQVFLQSLTRGVRVLPTLILGGLLSPLVANAAVPSLAECESQSNPAYTLVTCARYGLDKDNRPKSCESSENCLSTSSIRVPAKFSPPWSYALQTKDASQAWVDLIRAVEKSEGVRIVEIDNARYYLHAEAPSIGPPQGVDDLEFVLLPSEEMALYRSASRQSLFVYPLQQPVSDRGSIQKRLTSIQRALGWTTLGYGDRVDE